MFYPFICKYTIPSAPIISSQKKKKRLNIFEYYSSECSFTGLKLILGRRPRGQQGYPQSNVISLTTIFRTLWHYKLSAWTDHPTCDKNKVCIQVAAPIIKKSFIIWTHINRIIISFQNSRISIKLKPKFLPKMCSIPFSDETEIKTH